MQLLAIHQLVVKRNLGGSLVSHKISSGIAACIKISGSAENNGGLRVCLAKGSQSREHFQL